MTICKIDLRRQQALSLSPRATDPFDAYLRSVSEGTERLGSRAESGRWIPTADPNCRSAREAERFLDAKRRFDGLKKDVGDAFRSVPEGAGWRIRILVDRSRDADEETYAALCVAAVSFYEALSQRRGFSIRISVFPGLVSADFVTGRDRIFYDTVLPHAGNASAEANLAAVAQVAGRVPIETVLAAALREMEREPADERVLVTFTASGTSPHGEAVLEAARSKGIRTAMLTAGAGEPFGDVTARWTDGSLRTAVRALAAGVVARCGPEEPPSEKPKTKSAPSLAEEKPSQGIGNVSLKANSSPGKTCARQSRQASECASEAPAKPKRSRRAKTPRNEPSQTANTFQGDIRPSQKGNSCPAEKPAPAKPSPCGEQIPRREAPIPFAPGVNRDPAARNMSFAAWTNAYPMRESVDRILAERTAAFKALGSLSVRILLDASNVWAGTHRALAHAKLRVIALAVRDWLERKVGADVSFALTPGGPNRASISLDYEEDAARHRIGVLGMLTPGGTEAVGRALSEAVGCLEKKSTESRAVLLFTAARFDGRSTAPHCRDLADKGIRLGVFAFDDNPLACGDTFTGCSKESDLLKALEIFLNHLTVEDSRHTSFGPHRFLRRDS